jgi:hypothetical protein
MLRWSVGLLVILLLLAPGAAAAEPNLRPVSWSGADFGNPDDTPTGRFGDLCRLIFFLGNTGTANASCQPVTVQGIPKAILDLSMDPNQHFSWESRGLRIDVDLISIIEGGSWKVGYRNLQVSAGLVPQIGEPVILRQTVGWFRLDLQATARASFDVPQMGKAVPDIVFSVGDGVLSPDQIGVRSRRLGDFLSSGIRPVEQFLQGDEIILFAPYEFPDLLLRIIIEATADQVGFIESRTVTVEGPCGVRTNLDDCLVSLELSTPAPRPLRLNIP